jgi:hypothetical protein
MKGLSFHVKADRKVNIVASVSGNRRETGASSLRWDFKARIRASDDFIKARVDSSNELISSSIACRRWSQDSGEVSMKVIAGVDMVLHQQIGRKISGIFRYFPGRPKCIQFSVRYEAL